MQDEDDEANVYVKGKKVVNENLKRKKKPKKQNS